MSKRSVIKKIFAVILAVTILIGYTPIGSAKDTYAAPRTLYASYINRVISGSEACPDYLEISKNANGNSLTLRDLYSDSINLVMDQELKLYDLTNNISIVDISGSSKLTINHTFLQQKALIIEAGAIVELSGESARISESAGSLKIRGTIKCTNADWISNSSDIILEGGSITGTLDRGLKGKNIQINSGSIDISSRESVLNSTGEITINGGNVKGSSSNDSAIYANTNFTFNGGYVEVNSGASVGYMDAAIVSGKTITISDNCFIKTPENGYIEVFYSPLSCIKKANGEKALSVVLKEVINLEKATITGIKNKPYTGSPITQSPVVTYNGITLKEGTHFTTRYENNTAIGTATIVFEGIQTNDVKGTVRINFSIKNSSEPEDDVEPYNPSGGGNSGGNGGNGGSSSGGNGGSNGNKYSNEWVNGKWYNANGVCDYAGTLSWKSNASGWWVEDSEGWYPVSQWQKIDGKYYYFTASGYMDYSEYRDGCWLGADGAWIEEYYGGHWCSDSTGWWYEDASGWYPVSKWVWIDGYCYYFEASGYMATNKYVDGCWVGADGAWQ